MKEWGDRTTNRPTEYNVLDDKYARVIVDVAEVDFLASIGIRLLLLANDVSLRNLIPDELAKGFGFYQSKPATAFSPVAVTPDELGAAWDGGKVHLPLVVHLNGQLLGRPNAGDHVPLVTAPTSRSPARITAPEAGDWSPLRTRPTSLRATRWSNSASSRISSSAT